MHVYHSLKNLDIALDHPYAQVWVYLGNAQKSRLGTQRNSSKWGVIPLNMKGLVLYHNSLLLARMNAHELTGSFNYTYTHIYEYGVFCL